MKQIVRRTVERSRQALLVAVLVFGLAPVAVLAQSGGGWSTPLPLGEYWFPDVAVDGSGRVHTVWSSGVEGFDTVMYAAKTVDGWSRPVDIAAMPQIAGGSEASRPALLLDANQNLHLTYRDTTVYYTQAPAGGAGVPVYWRAPVDIDEGYFSRMAIDSQGVLHLVFTQNVYSESCRVCYHVFYLRSDDDGFSWSDPLDISVQLTGAAKPQIIVDRQDNLHVVWESGYGGSYGQLSDPTTVMHVASYNGGVSWSRPNMFAPGRGQSTSAMARNVTIAEDSDGRLIAIWWAVPEDIVYYQLSRDAGVTWSEPAPIPSVLGIWALYQSRLDSYTTAVDSAGRVHLVMAGRRTPEQTTAELLHVIWDGSSWSDSRAIVRYEGDMPEWPRIAVGLGNQLHVVWFVRDAQSIFNSDAGNYQVWYASSTTDSPAIAPVEVPAIPPPTPIVNAVAAIVIPTPTAQIAPVSVEDPSRPTASVLMPNIRSENDEVLLLLFSSIPVLVVVAFAATIFLVQRKRRAG
jgi:hypothetical protein